MIGEKLVIEQCHTDMAIKICSHLEGIIHDRFTISVAGESAAGKSVLSAEIARILTDNGTKTGILQQDDYFVFPPKTNHEMRRNNLEQVGLFEVKLDYLASNLRSFKRDESPIYRPLVIFDEDKITSDEMDVSEFRVLIAEGTYTSLLDFIDFRIFIDRDYRQSWDAWKNRDRDKFEPFMVDVLEREHQIISQHKDLANAIVVENFDNVLFLE